MGAGGWVGGSSRGLQYPNPEDGTGTIRAASIQEKEAKMSTPPKQPSLIIQGSASPVPCHSDLGPSQSASLSACACRHHLRLSCGLLVSSFTHKPPTQFRIYPGDPTGTFSCPSTQRICPTPSGYHQVDAYLCFQLNTQLSKASTIIALKSSQTHWAAIKILLVDTLSYFFPTHTQSGLGSRPARYCD